MINLCSVVGEKDVEVFRSALQRVLGSREFSSSRQLRQFLSFVCERAFEGRDSLDQAEIARHVLGRGDQFNPIDDASVRRIASIARQKLARYYTGEGASDPVMITLPVRSYIPVFECAGVARAGPRSGGSLAARIRLAAWAAALLSITVVVWLGVRWHWRARPQLAGHFVIATARGDVMNTANDVPAGNILLGPKIGLHEEVAVRMRFAPQQAYQQAGIMIFESADSYVKFARHFTTRTEWEFGLERKGRYLKPPGTWTYDPTGQDGRPVWLAVRRSGGEFRAFVSHDGLVWRQVGNTLRADEPMGQARIGLFAFNGQSDAASIKAEFDTLSLGWTAAGWPETGLASSGPWKVESSCPEGTGPSPAGNWLTFSFGNPSRTCNWWYLRDAPAGDWTVASRLDFLPLSGTVAGLAVRGKKGRFRVVRWALNGGSITAEFPPGNQAVSRPDFPGSPPITLRIHCKGGVLTADFSRDDREFIALPASVAAAELGEGLRFGVTTQLTTWNDVEALPSAQFLYVRQENIQLGRFR